MSTGSSRDSVASELARMDVNDDDDDDVICLDDDEEDEVVCLSPSPPLPLPNPFRLAKAIDCTGTSGGDGDIRIETDAFESFDFCDELMTGIRSAKLLQPFASQVEVLKASLRGTDVLCEAPSKSGKTAIFVLTTLHFVSKRREEKKQSASPSVLVVAPTRELAIQINREYQRLGMGFGTSIRVALLIGGRSQDEDVEKFTLRQRSTVDIVIGTPGRILDLALGRNLLKLDKVKHIVIDEVQRSIAESNMRSDVQKIFTATELDKQVMFFATPLSAENRAHCKKYLRDDGLKYYCQGIRRADTVAHQHRYLHLIEDNKLQGLLELLNWLQNRFDFSVQFVIFTDTIERTSDLTRFLASSGKDVLELDSQMSQSRREHSYSAFRINKKPVLVATDLAARGLDIPNVAVVVNFDRPRTPLDYKDRMRIIGKDVERSLVVTFCRYVDEMKFLMTDDELKAYRARPFEWTLEP